MKRELVIALSLAARRQGRGQRLAAGQHKQISNRHIQCVSERLNRVDRDVLLTALDPTCVRPVDACRQREALLRKPLAYPELSQVPAENLAGIHNPQQRDVCVPIIDGLTISDLFGYFRVRAKSMTTGAPTNGGTA